MKVTYNNKILINSQVKFIIYLVAVNYGKVSDGNGNISRIFFRENGSI